MKQTLSIVLLFCLLLGNLYTAQAQEAQGNLLATKFLPPAPNSASLGKFGGLHLGLSSGTMQHEIQLTNFVSGKINLPISLSYSSNGLKVDEIASRVGVSWNLNAGGLISRTVYGEPDEIEPRVVAPSNLADRSRAFINFLEGLVIPDGAPRNLDGEPDVFNFNFNGYSGRFILDAGLQPVLLTYSGLKIQRIDNQQFEITTPDGIKYVFGGTGALETQSTYSYGENCESAYTFPGSVVTAYYLKTVIHPLGDIVNFQYSAVSYHYAAGVNSVSSKSDPRTFQPSCTGYSIPSPPNLSLSCLVGYYTTTPVLNDISSVNGGEIKFVYKARKDLGDVLLDYLEVYQPASSSFFKKIKLGYSEVKSRSTPMDSRLSADSSLYYKPFLVGINEIGQGNLEERNYKFSYYNLGNITPRLSYAQDIYGYYNGKFNNTSPFAAPSTLAWQSIFPEANADRKIDPNFINTGLLAKIVYPTGGADSIIYESNTIYSSKTTPPSSITGSVYVTGSNQGIESKSSPIITVQQSQQAIIEGLCSYDPLLEDGDLQNYGVVKLSANGSLIFSKQLSPNENFREVVNLSPGLNYQISVSASGGADISMAAELEYTQGTSTTVYENQVVAGARVSKVITNPVNGSINTKKYLYSGLTGAGHSTGSSVFEPVYEYFRTVPFVCGRGTSADPGNPNGIVNCSTVNFYFYTLNASSINNLYAFSNAPVFYSSVIEEDGDGLTKNGGTEHHFEIYSNSSGAQLLGEQIENAPLTDNSWKNGREIYTYHYKYQNELVVPVQKIYTHFKTDSRVGISTKSYIVQKKYNPICIDQQPNQTEIDAYNLYIYEHNQMWIYADSIRTQLFDLNGQLANENLMINFYDNPQHALPSRTMKTKSDGSQEVSFTSYVSDYSDASGFIKDMQTAHLLSYPIEQVNYKQQGASLTIQSGNIIKYKAGGGGLIDEVLVLETSSPLIQSSFKFSTRSVGALPPAGTMLSFSADSRYKSRLRYDAYDTKGNPLQITPAGGVPISYKWGYGQQYPIAECKNALNTEFYYEGFEDNGIVSGKAHTGGKCTNNKGVTWTAPNSRAYVISYWYRIVGVWHYSSEQTYNRVSFTMQTAEAYDDIRIHPSDAQMTTYTYNPLVGMNSQTDAKGQTSYYDYDEFQRLKTIKDQDSNIIKSNTYHYIN